MLCPKKCRINNDDVLICISEDTREHCEICLVSYEPEFEGKEITQLGLVEDYQEKVLNKSTKTIQILFKFSAEILKSDQYSIHDLNDLLQLIQQYIEKLWETMKHINILKGNVFACQGVNQLVKYLDRSLNEIKGKLNMWLLEKQQNNDVNQLFEILNNENVQNNIDAQPEQQWQSKQLVVSTSKNRCECIKQIRINKNNTLMFICFNDQKTYLYGFNNNNKLIKKMTSQNGFFWLNHLLLENSSNRPDEIILWNNLQNPEIIHLQRLNLISCIILYKQDGFAIGFGKQIIFLKKSKQQWEHQLIIETLVTVSALRFNPDQTKLILYGEENMSKMGNIYLFEMLNEQWVETQNIKVEKIQIDISFTSNIQFVFQTSHLGFIEVYDYDDNVKQFMRTKPLYFSNNISDFPISHNLIDGTNILIVNQGNNIFQYIQFNQNCQHKLLQTIKYEICQNKPTKYSNVSINGHYFAISNLNQILVLRLRSMK